MFDLPTSMSKFGHQINVSVTVGFIQTIHKHTDTCMHKIQEMKRENKIREK